MWLKALILPFLLIAVDSQYYSPWLYGYGGTGYTFPIPYTGVNPWSYGYGYSNPYSMYGAYGAYSGYPSSLYGRYGGYPGLSFSTDNLLTGSMFGGGMCQDLSTQCAVMASTGQCALNPSIQRICSLSCGTCASSLLGGLGGIGGLGGYPYSSFSGLGGLGSLGYGGLGYGYGGLGYGSGGLGYGYGGLGYGGLNSLYAMNSLYGRGLYGSNSGLYGSNLYGLYGNPLLGYGRSIYESGLLRSPEKTTTIFPMSEKEQNKEIERLYASKLEERQKEMLLPARTKVF